MKKLLYILPMMALCANTSAMLQEQTKNAIYEAIPKADGSVEIYLNKALSHTLHGHTDRVTVVGIDKSSNRVITASSDCTARLWDLETGMCLRSFRGHDAPITAMEFNVQEGKLVTATADGTSMVWDLTTGMSLLTLKPASKSVLKAKLNRAGDEIETEDDDGTSKLYNAATGELLKQFRKRDEK